MKSRNRTIWKHLMGKRFFSRWGYALHFCWLNIMITENFSNSAAATRFCIELHLSCGRVPEFTPVFLSTIEVRLSGCLETCHSERLLRKTINCSILHRFALVMPALALLPDRSRNYHALHALILSCQIFRIYTRCSTIWLFHIKFIVYFSFYDNFCNYTSKEKRYKVNYRQKFTHFVILWNLSIANLDFFWLNRFLVPTPNTMSGVPCDDISCGKFRIWKTSAFQIH